MIRPLSPSTPPFTAASGRRILIVCLVYAALAGLTAFYPAFFGELPVPAALPRFLLPDGPDAASRHELDDVATEFLPWSRAVADAYKAGRLPLRLAANGCGSPLWANPQAQAVTPTTLFDLVMPESWASAASAALKLALGASGAFLLLRALGLSSAAAGWAGFAYGFSLHMTCWMHFPHTWPVSIFPWNLLAFLRVARGRPDALFPALASVFALLLGGYPEGEFYVAAATAVAFAAALLCARAGLRDSLARCATAAAASLLALGLSAAYTLPAVQALAGSERAREADRGTLMAPAPAPALALRDFARPPTYWDVSRFWVVPEAQGNPRDGDKFGPYSFAGRASGYSGILIVALALATFLWRRAPAPVQAARAGLLLLALYVLWYPPLARLLQAAPGIREAATRLTTNRANTIAVLLLVLLAAYELDRIRAGGGTKTTRLAIGLTLLGVLVVALEYGRNPERPPMTAWRASSFVFPVFALASVYLILARRWSGRGKHILVALLFVATGIDLLRIGARFNPGTRPSDYFPGTPFVAQLRRASRGARFATSSASLAGLAYMYGLEDVRLQDPVAPAPYVDALTAAAGYLGPPQEYFPRVTRLDSPFLPILNVRARFADGTPSGVRADPLSPQAAIFPERLIGAPDMPSLLEAMRHAVDFQHDAFVVGGGEVFSGRASLLSFERPRPEFLRILARSESPRLLLVAESDDGGWSAEADGQPLPTRIVNGAFLGIRIPAGETRIFCRYLPPGFRHGLALSVLSAAVLLILALRRPGSRRTGARSNARNSAAAEAPRPRRDTAPEARPPRPGGAA